MITVTTYYKDGSVETTTYPDYRTGMKAAEYRKSWSCVESVTFQRTNKRGFVL